MLTPGTSDVFGRSSLPRVSQQPVPTRSVPEHDSKSLQSASRPPLLSASPPTVLSIAGFDPSAGAGVLADLKTFAAHGVYGMACVTALTVQSTQGVRRVQGVDANIVTETLDCLAEDACFSAIKVGMLGSDAVAAAVAAWLGQHPNIPAIVDPVLKSSSGKDLLDSSGFEILRNDLLARADWMTPNLDELAVLIGGASARGRSETEKSGRRLLKMAAVRGNLRLKLVVTGGHAETPDDLFLTGHRCRWYPGERVETTSTHGTGCAFSSALAARVALGDDAFAAVLAAKNYITEALRHAFPVGLGTGPLNHAWRPILE